MQDLAIEAIVFDMDGLMFDTERLYFEAETELFAKRNIVFTVEMAQLVMGVPGVKAMQMLCEHTGLTEAPQALFDECRDLLEGKIKADLQLMPGLMQLLEKIEAAGLRKALATSTKRDLTDKMLAQYDLHRRFEFLLTKDDVVNGKPDPEIYQKACQKLDLEPGTVMVLEDSRNGTLAAKAAGCFAVAVPHALSKSIDFSFADMVADHLLDDRLLTRAGLSN